MLNVLSYRTSFLSYEPETKLSVSRHDETGVPPHSADEEEPGAVRGVDKEPDAEPDFLRRSRRHLLQVSQSAATVGW